jgi:tetratricopeptide (TPR) repeat protein
VGTALVAAAWGLLLAGVIKTWRFVRRAAGDFGNKQSNKFAFVLGSSAGLLALLCHSAVDFNFHIPANAILATTLMALLSGHLRFATERYWLTLKPLARVAGSLVLAVWAGYLGWQGWRHTREWVWLERAAREANYSSEQIARYERAFAIEPMNAETATAIGDAYRVQSKDGGDDYEELAAKAMTWFDKAIKLNPWEGYNYLRYGGCLDWVGRTQDSARYFDLADQLDPRGYFTAANIGLHYVQMRNYAAAKPWFERSRRLEWKDNPIAMSYLEIVNAKLLEAATNDFSLKLTAPAP